MGLLQRLVEINKTSKKELNLDKTNHLEELLQTITNINKIKDLDSLLEKVLYEARHFTNADAGTIYLSAKNYLYFNNVQNDTLFKNERVKIKYIYSQARMEIDKKSLAGYSALTQQTLLIDDVYDIKSNVDYSWNPSFDKKSSYKSKSILMVPLITRNNEVLGVVQLINAKDKNGDIIPFSMHDNLYIQQFAHYAANAIENAKLSRQMALRMVELAELRDPYETSAHAKRVGAYAVELYEQYAQKQRLSEKEIRSTKDTLHIAAMLHDIGKIAISDTILKKTSRLTPEEKRHLQYHTIYGARIFKAPFSPWDKMAAEVALNHHEKWDGSGYPGKIKDLDVKEIVFAPGKKETEIPIAARIVALADVYDSLISERAYKLSWDEKNTLRYIKQQSGKHFDPILVNTFFEIFDTIHAIQKRYD